MPTPLPEVTVDVADPGWVGLAAATEAEVEALVARAVAEIVARVEAVGGLTVRLTDDAEMQALNRDFRAKDRPTNVLSFPAGADEDPATDEEPVYLGDIAIGRETVTAEAAEQAKPVPHHLTHMVVHATLHLLGFDHQDEAEAEEMEGFECEILDSLGIPNPYSEER